MELKAGYKQTEVGVIPQEWDSVQMETITTHIGDGLHGTPVYSNNGRYIFINGNNLNNGKIAVTNDTKTVDHSEYIKHRKPLNDSSILMSINGTIGNLAMYDGEEIILGKSAAYLNVKQNISKLFVYHSLQTEIVKRQFFDGMTGSTIGNLGLATIRSAQLPLPPTETEQRAIATALSDVDAFIASLDRLIAKKRDMKQAAMQELLTGKRRLPGFSGEWEVKRLGEIAEIDPENLGSGTSPDYIFNYISLEDVDTGTLRGWTEQVFKTAPSRARRKLRKGDVLVSTVRPNLKSHLFIRNDVNDLVCSTGFSVVRCKPSCAVPAYIYSHLFAGSIERQIESLLTGSNYPAINSGDVKALLIPLPSVSEQTAIAAILSDMDTEIAALEQKQDKTRMLKQGMMQDLLTGKTRLKP